MEEYKLLPKIPGHDQQIIVRLSDNAHIPDDPDNIDYQEYMRWLAEGNIPKSPELEVHPSLKEDNA